MRLGTPVPIIIFVCGIACMAAAVLTGEAEVSLVLIFPIFSGSSGLFILGVILIMLSFIVGFVMLTASQIALTRTMAPPSDFPQEPVKPPAVERRVGGVVLVGPVPIAFGSDMKMALAMLVLGIVLAITALALIIYFV